LAGNLGNRNDKLTIIFITQHYTFK